MKASIPRAAAGHGKRNLEAAQHILANVEKYGGLDAGLVEWARQIALTAQADEKPEPTTAQLRLEGLEALR